MDKSEKIGVAMNVAINPVTGGLDFTRPTQPARDVAGLIAEAESFAGRYAPPAASLFRGLATALRDAMQQNDEWKNSFDIYDACQRRAVNTWKAKHPESPNTWPDSADGICAVFEELDQLRDALRNAEEEIKDRKEGQRSMTQRRHELEYEVDTLRAQLDAVTRENNNAR